MEKTDHDLLIQIAQKVNDIDRRLSTHINEDQKGKLLYLAVALGACVTSIGVFINGMVN